MHCRTVQRKLNAYLDRELATPERARVDAHLGVCAKCSEALDRLVRVGAALEQLPAPPPVPDSLAERVRARARQRLARLRPQRVVVRPRPLFWPVMGVAAAAILVLGLGLGALMGWDTLRPCPAPAALVGQAGPDEVYSLDYLTEAPRGSVAEAYLSLVSAANRGSG